MRRRGTTLVVVGAVALVAVLAAVDAFRGDARPAARSRTTQRAVSSTAVEAPPPTAAERLARRHVAGLLFATVRDGDGCRLELVQLPTLERARPVLGRSCRVRVSASARIATGDACPARSFWAQTDVGARRLRGCAPAWRPDGALTYVRDGSVVVYREPCASYRPCLAVAVPRGRIPGQPREIAWLSDSRVAVLVVRRPQPRLNRFLVVFDHGRVVGRNGPCCPGLDRLSSLPPRGLVARSGTTFLTFDRRGRFADFSLVPNALSDGRALAVSSDGRWMATTLGNRVELYRAGVSQPAHPVEIRLRAADLGWGAG